MKTRKNSFFVFTLLLVTALLHASDSAAKKPYALIFGTIYGADDRPVYGVKVKIRRADQKKAKWELRSDHQGEFAQRLPAGTADYVVSVDKADELKVHIESDERKDISVHLSR